MISLKELVEYQPSGRAMLLWTLGYVAFSFVMGMWVGGEYQKTKTHVERIAEPANISFFVDPLTGCQYLGTTNGDGFFPRMGRDGLQICTKHDSPTEN